MRNIKTTINDSNKEFITILNNVKSFMLRKGSCRNDSFRDGAEFSVSDGELCISVNTAESYSRSDGSKVKNRYVKMDDLKVRKYWAKKIKDILAVEHCDNDQIRWKSDCNEKSKFLGTNVNRCFKLYKLLCNVM